MPSPPTGERRGCACKEVAFPTSNSPKPLAETTQESQVKARYLVGRNFTYADIGGEYHDLLSHTNPPSYDFNNVSTIAVQLVPVGRKRFERPQKPPKRRGKNVQALAPKPVWSSRDQKVTLAARLSPQGTTTKSRCSEGSNRMQRGSRLKGEGVTYCITDASMRVNAWRFDFNLKKVVGANDEARE